MFKNLLKRLFPETGAGGTKPVRAQDIWWAMVADSAGTLVEQPVLVFRTFDATTLWALPLTAQISGAQPLYVVSSLKGKKNIGLSRMRTLHSQQLLRRVGRMSTAQFESLNKRVLELLKESAPKAKRPRVAPKKRVKPVSAPVLVNRPSPVRADVPRERLVPSPFTVYSLKSA